MMLILILRIALAYFLVVTLMKLYRNPSLWPHMIAFLPLTGFMAYARMKGMTMLAWKGAFIFAGILTIVVVAIQLYKKITIDRLMLGANAFFLVGATAFLCEIRSILYWYGMYKGAIFMACVVAVGCITLFLPTGFIGVEHPDSKKVYKTSLQLLGMSVFGLIWAFVMNQYGITVAAAIPFLVLKLLRDILMKKL